jgi:acyl-CoA synthetase (AMP-forming)/AMP-acid ligase II
VELTPDAVIAHCRDRLTRVKVPVEVTITAALPKNPVGKIDKPRLRTSLVA